MYEDPSRWSLTLQTYIQLTMLEHHKKETVSLLVGRLKHGMHIHGLPACIYDTCISFV